MIMYYDRHGDAIVQFHNKHLFDMKGKPLAFIYHNAIFNLQGKLLGYCGNGWICDKRNDSVLYTDTHFGGPIPPIHKIPPIPAIPVIPPVPPIPPIPPIPPTQSFSWSRLTAKDFFNQ